MCVMWVSEDGADMLHECRQDSPWACELYFVGIGNYEHVIEHCTKFVSDSY